ncbi:Hypothetical predicted protein [Pelobates cultripes]|uniref:Uncharacterized protein n=1 Tax=Pelobates cultripes TaxID=61616 RepID=A0AAD1RRP2_PELCU|nr:Hypothetical predicted protein [Pelobates cultripes]
MALNPPESKPVAPSEHKSAKKSCRIDEESSTTFEMDRVRLFTEDVDHNREPAHRAKSVRTWKKAKAFSESSDSDSEQEEELSVSNEDSYDSGTDLSDHIPLSGPGNDATAGVDDSTLLDPQGEQHPRSLEWYPLDHVAKYIAARIRKPLNKEARNKLRAECPRPNLPDMACTTPELDPKIAQFLGKTGWKAKKRPGFLPVKLPGQNPGRSGTKC